MSRIWNGFVAWWTANDSISFTEWKVITGYLTALNPSGFDSTLTKFNMMLKNVFLKSGKYLFAVFRGSWIRGLTARSWLYGLYERTENSRLAELSTKTGNMRTQLASFCPKLIIWDFDLQFTPKVDKGSAMVPWEAMCQTLFSLIDSRQLTL